MSLKNNLPDPFDSEIQLGCHSSCGAAPALSEPSHASDTVASGREPPANAEELMDRAVETGLGSYGRLPNLCPHALAHRL